MKKRIFLAITIAHLASACGGQSNLSPGAGQGEQIPTNPPVLAVSPQAPSPNPKPSVAPPAPIPTPDDGWTHERNQSADGLVKVDQSKITPDQFSLIKNKYQRVNLEQIPIDPHYNAIVFRYTDGTLNDFTNKALIAPRLFSYGSQQGGKLAPVVHANGTETISFNIAFLDGLTTQIQTPVSDEKQVTVPDNFAAKDVDGLRAELKNAFGIENGIGALAGCPKKITLMYLGREFDATPSDLVNCDFFQLNTPMTVSLTVPTEDANDILQNGLATGQVDVRGTFETRVSVPVVNVDVSFNRTKVYSDLQAELGVKAWFVDVDAKLAMEKVMKNQLAKVSIQGDLSNTALSQLIQQAMAEFYEPFKADPTLPLSPCGSAPVCLRLNYASQDQTSDFHFTWNQESNTVAGQNYITTTKLKATPVIVTLGKDQSCVVDCGRVSNNGVPRETGLTVVSGNQIVIEPLYVIKESQETPINQAPTYVHNNVCVRSHTVCTGRAGDGCVHGCIGEKLMQLMTENTCTNVCDAGEDRWTQTTQYSQGAVHQTIVTDPVGFLNRQFADFSLQFVYLHAGTGAPQVVTCPASLFSPHADGKTLQLKLENVPMCSPFTGDERETPLLYFINNIKMNESYTAGARVVQWNGQVLQNPTSQTFSPKVDFVGTIKVLGYAFTSEPTIPHPVH